MREATRDVQEHQDALQLRPTGHRGGDSRRLAAVRPEDQRVQRAIQGEPGSLRRRGRRHRQRRRPAARLARIDRGAEGSAGRGGQGEGARRPAIRPMTTGTAADRGSDAMNQATDQQLRQLVDDVYRTEPRRVFATLIRLLGDFDLAEDALHDAFAAAMAQWPRDGAPANPRTWLVSAGLFRAIDS